VVGSFIWILIYFTYNWSMMVPFFSTFLVSVPLNKLLCCYLNSSTFLGGTLRAEILIAVHIFYISIFLIINFFPLIGQDTSLLLGKDTIHFKEEHTTNF
jgi:hypothetical protein